MIKRPFHYHRYEIEGIDCWESKTFMVPTIPMTQDMEEIQFYSLKKDMECLRAMGAELGIVDPEVTSVGQSYEGRELLALKVGKGSDHKILLTGAVHAREWIALEITYLVAEYLITNYKPEPTNQTERCIKHLLDTREIWFIPMVNPDGHEYTVISNRNWRPSRKSYTYEEKFVICDVPNLSGGCRHIPVEPGTYTGVDINRNFGTEEWGFETSDPVWGIVTSRDPASNNTGEGEPGEGSIWCGPSENSETETKVIVKLHEEQKFCAGISYHNYSQLILCPDAADGNVFVEEVGQGMTELINDCPQENGFYEFGTTSGILYAATGSMMDFTYEQYDNNALSYIPELRPYLRGDYFPNESWQFSGLPESQIEPCFEENLGAALALIHCAGYDSVSPKKRKSSPCWELPQHGQRDVVNCWNVFKGWRPDNEV